MLQRLFLFFASYFMEVAAIPTLKNFSRWGVSMHYRWAGAPGETDMLSKGFKLARTDAVWDHVEYKPGEFNFSNYGNLVNELEAHGVQPMLILTSWGNPKFYDQRLPHDEHTRNEFIRFCLAMMKEFKGRNVVWELWNEPNIPNKVWPSWSGEQYGALAVQLGKAMNSAGLGDEMLVGPALSGMMGGSRTDWLIDFFKTGALHYMDAITVHPYMSTPEDAITGADCWGGLRYIMKQHGPELPVISGEWGWNTCIQPCDAHWGHYALSEYNQAEYVARQWLINWHHEVPSVWYEWHTNIDNPHSFEGNFGTVEYHYHNASYPYTPKPSYHAAVTLQKLFGNMEQPHQVGTDDYILRTTGPNDAVAYAVWSVRKLASKVTVPTSPPGCYVLYDLLGKEHSEECTTNDKAYIHVKRSFSPTYLVLNRTSTSTVSMVV